MCMYARRGCGQHILRGTPHDCCGIYARLWKLCAYHWRDMPTSAWSVCRILLPGHCTFHSAAALLMCAALMIPSVQTRNGGRADKSYQVTHKSIHGTTRYGRGTVLSVSRGIRLCHMTLLPRLSTSTSTAPAVLFSESSSSQAICWDRTCKFFARAFFICWLILFRGIHTEVITLIRTAFLAQSLECISLLWQPCCGVRLLLVQSFVPLGRS